MQIMGSPANITLGPQISTVTSAIEATLNGAASSSPAEAVGHRVDEVQKLAVYLRQLQEERGKIEAFKRELPLCMQLLDAAIETTKQRVAEDECSPTASLQPSVVDAQDSDSERSKRTTPVLENFMPLKRRWENQTNENEEDEGQKQQQQQKVVLGRPAWMGEAQLWTKHSPCPEDSPPSSRRHMEFSSGAKSPLPNARLMLSSKHRQGGAFVPFHRDRQPLASPPFSPPLAAAAAAGAVADAASLSLSTSAAPTASQNNDIHTNGDSEGGSFDVRGDAARVAMDYPAQTRPAAVQPQRKPRRCWSPELHRRFVSALQQLGGSQVATPKQIRELMKVDGLTNDEVKSHLQKYRLHTRRSSPSPSPSSHAPQLLILGWVPPECSPAVGAASQASTGGVCDDPQPALQQEHTPPQSLQGASPAGRGESPHFSSDSYVDESDDEQEGKSTTTSSLKDEEKEQQQQPLQSKRSCSTTCLPDMDSIRTQQSNNRDRSSSAIGKLQTFRKAKAAA